MAVTGPSLNFYFILIWDFRFGICALASTNHVCNATSVSLGSMVAHQMACSKVYQEWERFFLKGSLPNVFKLVSWKTDYKFRSGREQNASIFTVTECDYRTSCRVKKCDKNMDNVYSNGSSYWYNFFIRTFFIRTFWLRFAKFLRTYRGSSCNLHQIYTILAVEKRKKKENKRFHKHDQFFITM